MFERKLTRDEIYIGKRVSVRSLYNIKDTIIHLRDFEPDPIELGYGTIISIDNKPDISHLDKEANRIHSVLNLSTDDEIYINGGSHMNQEKLKLEDLKVGMTASFSQLTDIFDTFIYFEDFNTETFTGKIVHIVGVREQAHDPVPAMLRKKNGGLSVFYQTTDGISDLDFAE